MSNQLVQFITLLFYAATISAKMEAQLERFEQVSGFHLANTTGMRVRKYNRTTWILDGEGEVFQDVGDDHWFTLTAAYSRIGNNQFNEYPLKVPKDTVCNVLNGPYKEYQPYFIDWTNMPRAGDERLCPFPKGHYWVKDFAPEGGWIPPVVPDGYWRLTADVMDSEDNVVVRMIAHLRIVRSIM